MLHWHGYTNILSSPSSHWDLRRQEDVERFFRINEPEYVYLAAAKVGGIGANKDYPGHFIYDNLMIQTNIIDAARKFGVKKLLFLGSSCIYPKMCEQPIKEEYLMTSPLEPTNDAYAIAKIAGIKMCQSYRKQYGFNAISLMPWGDGSARREFLYVDDLAEACFTCMRDYSDSDIINVGTGEDITIKELSNMISGIVRYPGKTVWDTSKPNGTPRKLLDVTKIKSLGWEPKMSLSYGIQKTYEWYKNQ